MKSFNFPITRFDAELHLKAQHCGEYNNGVASGAYAGNVSVSNRSIEIWGYGGIKNTETLYLEGISHAISEIECWVGKDDYSVLIFAPSDGFKKYILKYVPIWIANNGRNTIGKVPDGFEAAKKCFMLCQLGKIHIERMPPRQGGPNYLKTMHAAKQISAFAYARGANMSIGIQQSGEGWESAIANEAHH